MNNTKAILNKSKCVLCERYNKTWYYTISRKPIWPQNMISGTPIKILGIYLFTILKLAKRNYQWGKTNEDYKTEFFSTEPMTSVKNLCNIHKSIILSKN